MNVTIIGTGNVATVLGRKIKSAGHTIVEVAGRHSVPAGELASLLGTSAKVIGSSPLLEAELYLLAVSDNALFSLPAQLGLKKGILVHTAGAVPLEVLAQAGIPYGVLYPLQSLRKEREEIPVIPLLVDAGTDDTRNILLDFAKTLSPFVQEADDKKRQLLHVSAVITSNFTNYLYTLADRFCTANRVDFNLLKPLIAETALRLQYHYPQDVQTGPAVRGDLSTLNKHFELLKEDRELEEIYRFLSNHIRAHYNV